MVAPTPGVRHTAFNRKVFQNNVYEIAANVGWFDEWRHHPWHSPDHWYPEDIEFIMAEQRAGKSRYRQLPNWFEQQMQQALTEDWYEDHLRALIARRTKKKK